MRRKLLKMNHNWTHQRVLWAIQKNQSIQFRLKKAMKIKKKMMANTGIHHNIMKNHPSKKKTKSS